GAIYPVNPKYDQIEGLQCYPSLDDLPEAVEHVVLGVSNERLEASLQQAINHGAKAVTIFASCYLENDTTPSLNQRLSRMARVANIPLCGGNGMGFANPINQLQVAAFPTAQHRMQPGHITWIAQSGSVFGALTYNDPRLKFNLCVSSGAEMVTTCVDYMDWALTQTSTRVIGMFLESVRDPVGFQHALRIAADKQIPIVIIKTGQTDASVAMALTHTGAVAGQDSAYQALFDKYGVIRVNNLDEMAAVLSVFSQPRRADKGGLVSIHDSGGECEMLLDCAGDIEVPIAAISGATRDTLRANLDPGLEPVNPLDAWGTGHNALSIFENCLNALLLDDDAAVGLVVSDLRDGHWHHENMVAVAQAAHKKTDKPVFFATNYSNLLDNEISLPLQDNGIPVIDGTREALIAVKALMSYRDFLQRPVELPVANCVACNSNKWRTMLCNNSRLNEQQSLALLADYGISVVAHRVVSDLKEAVSVANELGFPLVMKTAAAGVAHKTDAGGVKLNIQNEQEVASVYIELSNQFGTDVMLMPMLDAGVEIGLGIINDAQFGPVVMVSAGGVLIELLDDRTFAVAPCGVHTANRMLDKLKISRLLDGVRGGTPLDRQALVQTIVQLSTVAYELKDCLAEVDINPVIVMPEGCFAADALVVGKSS
ncbi:MAG: acetate--CoA ligase family protein, partial [Gammaproteobacteria bacterium]|nr:acetate--CoA ligase family protein [Gammaproteobacteria bacterium]